MEYYNTTNESGEDLKEHKAKANSQSMIIMSCIESGTESFANFGTTSSKLHEFLFAERIPITSVRRSVSDLVSLGVLEYGEKITGFYGRPESLIKLTNK